jgi:autotransporter translocation and assembly factor TamB
MPGSDTERPGGAQTGPHRRKPPVRLTVLWILLAAAALGALLVGAALVLVRIESVRDRLLDFAATQTGMDADTRLRVARVGSLQPLRVHLSGIDLERRGSDGQWRRAVRVGNLTASWSPTDLLAGRLRVHAVAADSVEILLSRLRPAARPAPRGSARQMPSMARVARVIGLVPPLSIDALELTRVALCDSAGVLFAGTLRLANLRSGELGLTGDVRGGELSAPRMGIEVGLGTGGLYAGRDAFLEIRNLDLVLGESRATLAARLDPGEPELPLRVHLGLRRLVPQPLAARYLPGVTWMPGDSLAGDIDARLGWERSSGELVLRGQLLGEALTTLSGRLDASGESLAVNDLLLTSDAGRLDGQLRWQRRRGVMTGALAWEGVDPASAWVTQFARLPLTHPVSGEARLEVTLSKASRPLVAGEVTLRDADPWGIEVTELRASGSAALGKRVIARQVDVRLPHGALHGAGEWPLDDGEAAFDVVVDSLGMDALPAAWRGDLTGVVHGAVSVTGTPRALELTGFVAGERVGWRDWRADTLRIDQAVLRTSDLSGEADLVLGGVSGGRGREGMGLRAQVARTASGRITAAARLTHPLAHLQVAGEIDPRGALTLDSLAFASAKFGDWLLERPFHARWSAAAFATDSLQLAGAGGELRGQGAWERASGRVDGSLTLRDIDLRVLNVWLAGEDSLRGRCNLTLVARGALPDPHVDLTAVCDTSGFGPFDFGKIELACGWADETLTIGPMAVRGSTHAVTIPKLVLKPQRPLGDFLWPAARGTAAARPPLTEIFDAPWVGLIEIERISIAMFSPLMGPLMAMGAIAQSGATSILVAGEAVPLRILTPWDRQTTQDPGSVGGLIKGRITVGGTPRSPTLRLEATSAGLHFAQAEVGGLALDVTYADSLVRLDELRLSQGPYTTWARGYYPFLLSVAPPRARRAGGETRVEVELDHLDLAIVSHLTPLVPDASGQLSGQILIEGSGLKPQPRGTLALTGGGMRIPSRSERIYDAQGTLVLGPDGLEVRALDARTGPHGTVSAVGTFSGPENFDFSIMVNNARVWEEGLYDFQAKGDLNAYTSKENGKVVPHLTGVAEVLGGTLTQNLSEKEPLDTSGEAITWVIDLDVNAPGAIHVSQINAKADVGEGSLHIAYRWPFWNLSGTLQVLSGTYRLLNNTFTITGGTVEFRDTGAGPDLTLSVDAETFVAIAAQNEGPSETVTIKVNVHGKPEALEVTLSSQPALSEEEIVELLSFGRFTRTGRFEAGSESQWILLNTMVDRVETSLIEQSPIFSRVGITAGSSGADPLRVTWRPIVTPVFQINYAQDLTLDPEVDLSMNYRLSRVLYLRAGVARDRQSAGGFNDEYSLDLKCRFEYE